jgi:predicted ester cyclase
MNTQAEQSKAVVRRFNQEIIEQGNEQSFLELMDERFINHSAPTGMDAGPGGMIYFFNSILRPALADLQVMIHDQVAEGDVVTTRKTISGTHTGNFMGIAPTKCHVSIDVIDIVRIKDGKYFEHWGITSLPVVLAALKEDKTV